MRAITPKSSRFSFTNLWFGSSDSNLEMGNRCIPHHTSLGTDGFWSFNEVGNYNHHTDD